MEKQHDWNEEIEDYDANAALTETRIMWLKLGRAIKDWAEGTADCMDSMSSVDEAMAYAARAEACFWRATGDAETIDTPSFISELRARGVTLKEGDA